MVKKVVIGNATLYHGDCRDVLDKLPMVDIVVTSPMYNTFDHKKEGSGLFKGNSWIKKSAMGYPDKMDEKEYQKMLREIFDASRKKTKGITWINHKIRYVKKMAIHPARIFPYPIYSEIIWNRRQSFMINARRFWHSHEGVWGFDKPHYWNSLYDNLFSVWTISPSRDPLHPCTFPNELIKPLIVASSPPNGIVLDLFGGMFTAGIESLLNGRQFIGIEKEKKYFDEGCRRIKKLHNEIKAMKGKRRIL